MKDRRPKLDFSTTPARWTAIPEFAQTMNATSLWIPHLERFLNRVMAKAARTLQDDAPDTSRIRADVRMFIRQEANHFSLHASFNSILSREGYDVAAFERHFEAEFERLLATKSLPFLCAYCEGFETMGPPSALAWLDEMDDMLEGADPQAVKLWKWHLMEEFEHRSVCHDVFHAVHGGYFMRIYGLLYQFKHLMGFSAMVQSHLLKRDRQNMTPAEHQASCKRARAAQFRVMKAFVPRVLRALSPFYTPRKAPEPRRYRSYMAMIEAELE